MSRTIEYDNAVSRSVVVGLITDKTVLARVAPRWTRDGLFEEPYLNPIGKWCVDHFNRYKAAPNKDIEARFRLWQSKTNDEALANMVERLLASLSEEYRRNGKQNSEFAVDVASKHFRDVALKKLLQAASDAVASGQGDKAEEMLTAHKKLDMGSGTTYDPFAEISVLEAAFSEARLETLVPYEDQSLKEFFRNVLVRDSFVAVTGIDKSGKSYLALDMAFRAVESGRRVLYFECGDLSRDDITMRIAVRYCKRPRDQYDELLLPNKVTPRDLKDPRGPGPADVEYSHVTRSKLTFEEAKKRFDSFRENSGNDYPLFQLAVHPNSTVTVDTIRSEVDNLAQKGFVADCVFIDYSDILAPPFGFKSDLRGDIIDENWKRMRALSQEFHCLVVTPTQANAEAYNAHTLTRKNFSGDKRKNAHVVANMGINGTQAEKQAGLSRFNWIVNRNVPWRPTKCVHVAGCLALANPCMRASF